MTKPIKVQTIHVPQVENLSRSVPPVRRVSPVRRVPPVNPPQPPVPPATPVRQVPQTRPGHSVRTGNHAETTRSVQQPANVDTANGSTRKTESGADQTPVKPTSPIYVPEEDLITAPPPGFVPVFMPYNMIMHSIKTGTPFHPLTKASHQRIKQQPSIIAHVPKDVLTSRGQYYPFIEDLEKYGFYIIDRNQRTGRSRKIKLTPKHLKDPGFMGILEKLYGSSVHGSFSGDQVVSSALRAIFDEGRPVSPQHLEELAQYAHKNPAHPDDFDGPFIWHEPNLSATARQFIWDPESQRFIEKTTIKRFDRSRGESVDVSKHDIYRREYLGVNEEQLHAIYNEETGDYDYVRKPVRTKGIHDMAKRFPRGFRYYDGHFSHTSTDSTPLLWGRVAREMGDGPGKMFADFVRRDGSNIDQITTNSLGDAGVEFNKLMENPEINAIISKYINESGYLESSTNVTPQDAQDLYNLILPYYHSTGIEVSNRLKEQFNRMVKKDPKLSEGVDMIEYAPINTRNLWWLDSLFNNGIIKVSAYIPRMMFGKYKQGGRFYSDLNMNRHHLNSL